MLRPTVLRAVSAVWLAVMSGLYTQSASASDVGVSRVISQDDDVQLVVGPNHRVTPGEYNEPWIAASPENPDFLIAVTQVGGMSNSSSASLLEARHNAALLSRDGGQTWETINLPGYEPWSFDPMVIGGPDGRMYVMYTLIGQNTFGDIGLPVSPPRREGLIMVWSTGDEGKSWDGPVELQAPVPPDHPRLAVDWSDGPHRGRLYVVWNDVIDSFLRDEFQVFLHYVDDAGATGSEPKLLAQIPGGKLVATEPVVLSDGTLLVTFYQYFFPLADAKNETMPFFVMRSTDGGETFTEPVKAFEVGPHSWTYAMTEMASAFTLPIVTTDRSPSSEHRDNVYVVWDDVRGGQSNIWFTRSTDGGRSWSERAQLNDNDRPHGTGPLDDRMIPTVDVNRNGVIGVAWYDRRRDPARRCWEMFFSASTDGGNTFSPNQPISSAASCPPSTDAPTVRIHNLGTDPTVEVPTAEQLAQMSLLERMPKETEMIVRRANEQRNAGLRKGRVEVTFDRARGAQPGHYAGLAADTDGIFHALWINRRNDLDELFTTTVQVRTDPLSRPSTTETDVTSLVLLKAGPPSFNPADNTVEFEMQVRNVSGQTIYGPLRIVAVGIVDGIGGASAELLDSEGVWKFDGRIGSHDRLAPMEISEPIKVRMRVMAERGLDGTFDFEVRGQLPR